MLIDDIVVSEPLNNQHSFARFSAGDEFAMRKKSLVYYQVISEEIFLAWKSCSTDSGKLE